MTITDRAEGVTAVSDEGMAELEHVLSQLDLPPSAWQGLRASLAEVRRREALEDAAVADTFALVAFNVITEPGDSTATALIDALGPVAALAAALDRVVDLRPRARCAADDDGSQPEPEARLDPVSLSAAYDRWAPRLRADRIVQALTRARRSGARLVLPGDDAWPCPLDDLGPHRPVALWVFTEQPGLLTTQRQVSIVGSRAMTAYGEHLTNEFAHAAGESGFTVVSGGAFGVDAVAHRAGLLTPASTIAVLAGGVDKPYPVAHEGLLRRISEEGALVSELPCGQTPTKWRFLQRNRLIAAASCATIVMEAGWRSGALNTLNHANALGRAVGAVPGAVTSHASAGCNRAIREGYAELIGGTGELLELLRASVPSARPGAKSTLRPSTRRSGPAGSRVSMAGDALVDPGRDANACPGPAGLEPLFRGDAPLTVALERVRDALPVRSSLPFEAVVGATGMSAGEVRGHLIELLELGSVRRDPDGTFRRAPKRRGASG